MNDLLIAIFELTLILFLVNLTVARKLILYGGAIRQTGLLFKIILVYFFKKKIIGGSYEQINRFYFLYEILKEPNIVNVWGKVGLE